MKVECPHCSRVLRLESARGNCPACGKPLAVDSTAAPIRPRGSVHPWLILSVLLFAVACFAGFDAAFILSRADNAPQQIVGYLAALLALIALIGVGVIELLRAIASRD